ncbi:GPI ethanolamine phosphate transferase 2 [Zophobas morio]|uniref:GPI ethanolamine phosphate transferase 2 n=1 Tax=Zophobas morio TaxID=2755281 RepID=UPI0030830D6B
MSNRPLRNVDHSLNHFCDRFCYYLIGLLSILVFLKGFFPIPPRPSYDYPPNNVTIHNPPQHKAVFIVIDALRLDFVSDATTPFLSRTFKNSGCFIHLKVETPTVTLPRIKALTTGYVPQFIDIILNLAVPTKVEDSFIHRAHANGKRIVFYGDDIWVKLFPEEFVRSEGTSSFFVNDYTEVDDNVTRNVRLENERNDWDIMILHYLGLDHIGHVYGPKSPLILTKLREMDYIIEEIYGKNNNTLIVVTGDHGMRDGGGHGGSTYPETNVPLVVLGMPCKNDTFAQIDVAANLALLLGFDIPPTSIGQLHDTLLTQLSRDQYLRAVKYNTDLLRKKQDPCKDTQMADQLFDLYMTNNDAVSGENATKIYKSCSKMVSEKLQHDSTQQDIFCLLLSVFTGAFVIVRLIKSYTGFLSVDLLMECTFVIFLLWPLLTWKPETNDIAFYCACVYITMYLCALQRKDFSVIEWSFWSWVCVIHPFIFLSSSFLEEEHQFWYFATNTFLLYNIVTNREKLKWGLLFVVLRFVRTMNQVGDQWAGAPDLSDWLLQEENRPFLVAIFGLGLALTFYVNFVFRKDITVFVLDLPILVGIFVYRIPSNENHLCGKVLWSLIFVKLAVILIRKHDFLPVWTLTISLLLKPYNVVLIPACAFASVLFQQTLPKQPTILAHMALGNLLFFAQGHDNSLSSVDISSGYVGLTHYNPFFVFPQVLSHTYALPILSHLLLFVNTDIRPRMTFPTFFGFRLYIALLVFLVTYLHRHHLFIWSVFAPKMFVEASHYAMLFIEVFFYYVRDEINKLYK